MIRLEYLAGYLSGVDDAEVMHSTVEMERRKVLADIHLGSAVALSAKRLGELELASLPLASPWSLLAQVALELEAPGSAAITTRMIEGFEGALDLLAESDDPQRMTSVQRALQEGTLGLARTNLKSAIRLRVEGVASRIAQVLDREDRLLIAEASEMWAAARMLSHCRELLALGRGYPVGSARTCVELGGVPDRLFNVEQLDAVDHLDATENDAASIHDAASRLYVRALSPDGSPPLGGLGIHQLRAASLEAKVVILFQAQLGAATQRDELRRIGSAIESIEQAFHRHVERLSELGGRASVENARQSTTSRASRGEIMALAPPAPTASSFSAAPDPTPEEPPKGPDLVDCLLEVASSAHELDRFLQGLTSQPSCLSDELVARFDSLYSGDGQRARRLFAILRQLAQEPGDEPTIPVSWDWLTERPRAIKMARRRLLGTIVTDLGQLCEAQLRIEGATPQALTRFREQDRQLTLPPPVLPQSTLDVYASIAVHARHVGFHAQRNAAGIVGHVTAIWKEVGPLRRLLVLASPTLPAAATHAAAEFNRAASLLSRPAARAQTISDRSNSLAVAARNLEAEIDLAVR